MLDFTYDKSSDSVIVFDGKEPNRAAKWFELSQATERFAEYHCGTPGVEIWLGASPELTDENVTDAAQDALAFIRVYNGIREGDSSARDEDFWQIPFQNEFRGKLRRKLFMFLHEHSTDRFRAWLDDFDAKTVDNVRDAGMKEYGQVMQAEPATKTTLQRAKYAEMKRRMAERSSGNGGGRGDQGRQSNSNVVCRQWQPTSSN